MDFVWQTGQKYVSPKKLVKSRIFGVGNFFSLNFETKKNFFRHKSGEILYTNVDFLQFYDVKVSKSFFVPSLPLR